MPETPKEQGLPPVERLLRTLDLRPTDFDRFRGDVDQDEGRLFGGLVLAQSLLAAYRTVDRGVIHSLHSYFLRAGKPVEPIDYLVERIREGRNFLTRRVTALQGGHTIFEASVSFVGPEDGLSFQTPMPEAPDPEGQPSWWSTLNLSGPPDAARRRIFNPIDIRAASPSASAPADLPRRTVWAKPAGPLPDDPSIHAAVIAYMSDSGMVATVAHPYGLWGRGPSASVASLDHAIWFHHPPRFDDWLLYTSHSPAAHAARALLLGEMYNRDGVRVASIAQEGLFRQGQPKPG